MISVWSFIAGIIAFAFFGFLLGIVVERDQACERRRRK